MTTLTELSQALTSYVTNAAIADLPAPVVQGQRVLDLVKADVWRESPVECQIEKDLEARAEKGLFKYGHYLHTQDGRPPLVDAYQEALDLLMYVAKDNANGQADGDLYSRVWAVVNILRRLLNGGGEICL
jgi:hypothetical protein